MKSTHPHDYILYIIEQLFNVSRYFYAALYSGMACSYTRVAVLLILLSTYWSELTAAIKDSQSTQKCHLRIGPSPYFANYPQQH